VDIALVDICSETGTTVDELIKLDVLEREKDRGVSGFESSFTPFDDQERMSKSCSESGTVNLTDGCG
jgi:hypothetical protein